MKIGTIIYTWLRGELVGTDEFGNRYYRNTKKRRGKEQRWVIYKGEADGSAAPPEWHAWLHHTTDEPLTEKAAQMLAWQKEHEPNMTGTPEAYMPRGHDRRGGRHAPAHGEYEAWSPE